MSKGFNGRNPFRPVMAPMTELEMVKFPISRSIFTLVPLLCFALPGPNDWEDMRIIIYPLFQSDPLKYFSV